MGRKYWKRTLVSSLAWAGLALGQSPYSSGTPESAGPVAPKPEKTLTLTEASGRFKCRLIESWVMADGHKAHQVQAIDSGEMITVVEQSNGPARIHHWGTSKTPPESVPVPPTASFARTTSVQQANHVAPTAAASATPEVGQTLAVYLDGNPNHACRVVKSWTTQKGTRAHIAQSAQTGEWLTVEEGVPGPGPRNVAMTGMHVYRWGTAQEPPPNAPVPPDGAPQVASATTSPTTLPALPTATPTPTAVKPIPVTVVPPTPAATGVTTTVVQAPKTNAIKNFLDQPLIKSTPSTTVENPVKHVPATSSVKSMPTTTLIPSTQSSTTMKPSATVKPTMTPRPSTAPVADVTPGQTAKSYIHPNTPVAKAAPETTSKQDSRLPSRIGDIFNRSEDFPPPPPPPAAMFNKTTGTETTSTAGASSSKDGAKQADAVVVKKESSAASAKSSDWRSSWGKADDHKSTSTPVTRELPHSQSVTVQADPLKEVDKYNKRQPDAKGSVAGPVIQTSPGMESSTVVFPAGQTPSLGAGSVAAAGAMPGQVQYVPVPVITMPDARHAPVAPTGRPPMPPQPVQQPGLYGPNAFSPPVMPPAQPNPMGVNAFTRPVGEPAPNGGVMLPPTGGTQMVGRANANDTRGMAASPTNAGGHTQVAYNAAMDRRHYTAPAAQPVTAPVQGKAELLGALKDSLYPSQREWAAETLAKMDPLSNPDAVKGLVAGAKDDPAATVRAACVRCLVKMRANTPDVTSVLQSLKSDADARVRAEVERALTGTTPAGVAIQPVGFEVPRK